MWYAEGGDLQPAFVPSQSPLSAGCCTCGLQRAAAASPGRRAHSGFTVYGTQLARSPRSVQVGNDNFVWAFQELVDLSYLWSLPTQLNITNSTIDGSIAPADTVLELNATVVRPPITPRSPSRRPGWHRGQIGQQKAAVVVPSPFARELEASVHQIVARYTAFAL